MKTIAIHGLLIFFLVSVACRLTDASSIVYFSEDATCLGTVHEEYGENTLQIIKPILSDRQFDYSRWRRAVTATSFLGNEGASALEEELMMTIMQGDYGEMTSDMLDALGRIVDKRAVEVSLAILHSLAPQELKVLATTVLANQVRATSMSKYICVLGRLNNGDQLLTFYGIGDSGVHSSDETCSRGTEMDKDRISNLRKELADILLLVDKQDTQVGDGVKHVISEIDARMQRLEAEEKTAMSNATLK